MRKTIFAMAGLAAVAASSWLTTPVQAMTVGTASGIHAAADDTSLAQPARYVCRVYRSGRRVCRWTNAPYGQPYWDPFWPPFWQPWRPYYRPYYYRPYRPWVQRRYWRHW